MKVSRVDDLKRWNTAIVEMPKPILGVKWTGTDLRLHGLALLNMAKDSGWLFDLGK